MAKAEWSKAIKNCADPQRARHFYQVLSETDAGSRLREVSREEARILAAVFGGSEALSNLLVKHPGWLDLLRSETLAFGRRKEGLAGELEQMLKGAEADGSYEAALRILREFKQREMLRIGARDLARLGNVQEIV